MAMESDRREPEPAWARGLLAGAMARVRTLESRLDLRFRDPDLPAQALLHRSAVLEQERAGHTVDWIASNERLEFLGDAVLNALAADLVYERLPQGDEGQLTEARSALVRRATFALLAEDLGLGDLVYMSHAERQPGGRGRTTVLAEAFEAVMGAVYLDHGWDAVRRLAQGVFAGRIDDLLAAAGQANAKAHLQRLAQARLGALPDYRVLERRGPDHASRFTVEARVMDYTARGEDTSRKRAEQAAAQALLGILAEAGLEDLATGEAMEGG